MRDEKYYELNRLRELLHSVANMVNSLQNSADLMARAYKVRLKIARAIAAIEEDMHQDEINSRILELEAIEAEFADDVEGE